MTRIHSRNRAGRAAASPATTRWPAIDGYRISRPIAEGRRAAVYLAEQRGGGGPVALKVMKRSPDPQALAWRWFAAGCDMLSSVRHDNVVRVFGHGTHGDLAYLAMEYLEGGTLRDGMRAPMTEEHALAMLRQAAEGVAALHREGIVHRDVKPENFLLRAPGVLVVADLGVASRLGEEALHVPPGKLVGTLCYAAPEQVQGQPPSPAADVYSLGILFHELLCGRPPFSGTTPLELLAQHLVAPVPRLPARLARYQPIVSRMLEKRPECRAADADAVLEEIQRLAPAVEACARTD
jgi:eukaryotic-like serine/threonine-protein kinase